MLAKHSNAIRPDPETACEASHSGAPLVPWRCCTCWPPTRLLLWRRHKLCSSSSCCCCPDGGFLHSWPPRLRLGRSPPPGTGTLLSRTAALLPPRLVMKPSVKRSSFALRNCLPLGLRFSRRQAHSGRSFGVDVDAATGRGVVDTAAGPVLIVATIAGGICSACIITTAMFSWRSNNTV